MDCTDSIDVSLSREKRKKQITHFYTLEKKKTKNTQSTNWRMNGLRNRNRDQNFIFILHIYIKFHSHF